MLAPENNDIITNTLGATLPNKETYKPCGLIGYKIEKFDNNQIKEFVNIGKNTGTTKDDVQTQFEKFIRAKNKIRKVNPIPNYKVRKPITEMKIHILPAEMKPKGGTTTKKNKNQHSNASEKLHKDLLSTINDMKKTIIDLSTQLEEERAKNRKRAPNTENIPETDRHREQQDTEAIKHSYNLTQETDPHKEKKGENTYKRPRQSQPAHLHQGTSGPSRELNRDPLPTPSQEMDCEVQNNQWCDQAISQSDDEDLQEVPNRPISTNMAKPPIINIVNTSQQVSYRLFKETLGLSSFIIKRLNSNKHYVQLENLREYKTVLEALTQRGIKYYTFTPKSLKL